MFGNNTPRGPDKSPGDKLQVHETFYTIQGEGPYSGYPAVFLRLTGCNLRCWFCDTKWDDDNDPSLSIADIVAQIAERRGANRHCRLVVITGGEPLRQNLSPLLHLLSDLGYLVQIETAGTYWQDCLTLKNVTVVVSPKSQRVHPKFYEENQFTYQGEVKFCWKYVLKAGELSLEDGLPEKPFQRLKTGAIGGGRVARPPQYTRVYIQPCDEYDQEKNMENYKAVAAVSLQFGYIAGVQVHKHLLLP